MAVTGGGVHDQAIVGCVDDRIYILWLPVGSDLWSSSQFFAATAKCGVF
jgi:hypothetical protein